MHLTHFLQLNLMITEEEKENQAKYEFNLI